jgi:signal transduction histidine kinase
MAQGLPGYTMGLDHVLILPLLARGRTLGALTLVLGPSGRRHGFVDLALADDLAGRAAIALDNTRLYEDIQEANRRKNDFLAMLAHELRNPLAPIRNSVQVLHLLDLQNPQLVQARGMIDRQVTHLARLIEDLLDMSRLSRGRIVLRKVRLNLVQLIRATLDDYRRILETAGLMLELDLPEYPLFTHGDSTRLTQVLGNVLHNASKFTDAGGKVSVQVRRSEEGGRALISVRDTGIGIEPTMLSRIFETFSQADNSLHRSRGGLGLGLALVKGLVDLHGGEVNAFSEGLGQGVEIVIRLPLACSSEAPWPSHSADTEGGCSHRILVIEDNVDAAESMRMLLKLAGHQVEVAFQGGTGIQAARTFKPDVVLCDIGLPGSLDGYGVAKEFRRESEFDGVYLIASTGYGQEEDQKRCREAGFDAHLIKPVDFTQLQRLLSSLPARISSASVPAPPV